MNINLLIKNRKIVTAHGIFSHSFHFSLIHYNYIFRREWALSVTWCSPWLFLGRMHEMVRGRMTQITMFFFVDSLKQIGWILVIQIFFLIRVWITLIHHSLLQKKIFKEILETLRGAIIGIPAHNSPHNHLLPFPLWLPLPFSRPRDALLSFRIRIPHPYL